MKKPPFGVILVRRHYHPVPAQVTDLPFVVGPRNTRCHGYPYGSLWFVPPASDYRLAQTIAREYAAHFVQYLKDNPNFIGHNLLSGIIMDMNQDDASAAADYRDGFFATLGPVENHVGDGTQVCCNRMMKERFVLTDAQWKKMSVHCLGKPGDPGRHGQDNRLFVEAVLWIARTGSPWRDLPLIFREMEYRI